ncbi:MAG TPA: tripartite tricarboxylate transporter TctB family protein [Hyphomicrobiaceae bacterium]|nr:tripartite tricarboxylate transporter TctB family protein [Hyphomicrobiaceae bacterium]
MKNTSSNSNMTVGLLVIFTVMVAISSQYPAGARFMTFVVGLPAIALCLLQLALDARERRLGDAVGRQSTQAAPSSQPDTASAAAVHDPRKELIVWGYFLALIAGVLLFGFYATIPVFIASFLRFQARASWLMSLGLAAAAGAVVYGAFEHVLRVPLHSGFLTDDIQAFLQGQ